MEKAMILECINLDYNGKGVCKKDGFVYFVDNLLPGETANVKITKLNKKFGFGEVVEHIVKSEKRKSKEPLSFGNLFHLNNLSQLDYQTELTRETFKKISDLEVQVNPIITDDNPINYRNKITLHVKKVSGRLIIGTFENKSHRIERIKSHALADHIINRGIVQLNIVFSKYEFQDESLRKITLRSNNKDLMIIFTTKNEKWLEKELILSELNAYSIYQNISEDDSENLGDKSILLKGESYLPLELLGLKFKLYPTGFFQTNYKVTEMLYQRILDEIKPIKYFDAYAGAATIGQIISKKAAYVYSVDNNQDSVNSAKESMKLNQINNLEVILGDVNDEVNNLEFEGIVFDPPRSGLTNEMIESVLNKEVSQIIYISCNLKTLSRDIGLLLTNYKIKSIVPVKMFYQTTETETIVILERI